MINSEKEIQILQMLQTEIAKLLKIEGFERSRKCDLQESQDRIDKYSKEILSLKKVIENNRKHIEETKKEIDEINKERLAIDPNSIGVEKRQEKARALLIKIKMKQPNFAPNKVYCLKCKEITPHDEYPYIDMPFGGSFGGTGDYSGLQCSKCGEKIHESETYKRVLVLYSSELEKIRKRTRNKARPIFIFVPPFHLTTPSLFFQFKTFSSTP